MSSASQNVQLFIDAWKLLVGRLPEGTIRHEGHVATMFGNISLPFLNISLHDCPLPDRQALRRVLTTALERATSYPYPWMFGLSEDWAPLGWEEVAADLGLSCVDRLTGMAAAALKPPRRPLPAMEYRRVQTDATARDLSDVNREAYGMPQELFEGICNLHLWKPDSHGYVAYEAGRAISAAAAFPVAGTVYVALVATLPGQQGKGYAEAVMRHCIGEAQKAMGVIRTSLHATEIGLPLYRALGYESLSRIFTTGPKRTIGGFLWFPNRCSMHIDAASLAVAATGAVWPKTLALHARYRTAVPHHQYSWPRSLRLAAPASLSTPWYQGAHKTRLSLGIPSGASSQRK